MKITRAWFNEKWNDYWIYIIPLILCLMIMLPRLINPEFGLMDDGDTTQKANLILSGDWGLGSEASAGRFRPLYWYIHMLLFRLFGVHPAGFFFVNFLAFALLLFGTIKLLLHQGSSKMVCLLACILFIFSGPIAESYYTLSKYEIFQLVFIIYAILLYQLLVKTRTLKLKIVLGIGVLLLSLMSILTKETSLVMPAIYLGWTITCFLFDRSNKQRLYQHIGLLGIGLTACLVYFIWRGQYLGEFIPSGSYAGNNTGFGVPLLIDSLVQWESWLRRDFSYSAVLTLAFILGLIFTKRKSQHTHLLLNSLIWAGGWLAIFLPWVIKVEYYLLPFALGCSILSAHLLDELSIMIRHGILWKKVALVILVSIACMFFTNSMFLIINNARYQLVMDEVNARMLKYLAREVPLKGTVFVNLPADNEYLKEIQLHFTYIYARPDIVVSRFYYQATTSTMDQNGNYVITPEVQNRPTYSVRYAFNEDDSTAWTYSVEKYMAGLKTTPINFTGEFLEVEPHIFRIICPFLRYLGACQTNSQILEIKELTYQWNIYPYHRGQERAAQPGIYQCGLWRLRQLDGSVTTFNFGGCDNIPVVGDWNGDLITDFGIYSSETNEWAIDWNHDEQAELTFQLDNMTPGDIPIVGDWDGDGRDTPGFYRPSEQQWVMFDGNPGEYKVTKSIAGGMAGSIPLVGDWDMDSKDTWGVYQPETGEVNLENSFEGDLTGVDFLLPAKTTLIVSDWYGTGRDTLAFIDKVDWVILPANCACDYPNYPPPYRFPIENGIPVGGIWP
jgi:hypothetical protein